MVDWLPLLLDDPQHNRLLTRPVFCGTSQMIKQLADRVVDSVRDEPLALTLLVVNVGFLVGFALVFNEIAKGVERKDALVLELLEKCPSLDNPRR
jgi:hypothetical protein